MKNNKPKDFRKDLYDLVIMKEKQSLTDQERFYLTVIFQRSKSKFFEFKIPSRKEEFYSYNDAYHNYDMYYDEYYGGFESAPQLLSAVQELLEKARAFAESNNLIKTLYDISEEGIEVSGYANVSDQVLIAKQVKYLKSEQKKKDQQKKTQEESKQAKVSTKEEAQKEIKRLQAKFNLL